MPAVSSALGSTPSLRPCPGSGPPGCALVPRAASSGPLGPLLLHPVPPQGRAGLRKDTGGRDGGKRMKAGITSLVHFESHNGSPCCGSAPESCLTLCNPGDCSLPGFPVHHHLPGLAQTHVHGVNDAIQPSNPLSSPSPPACNLSQHQGLFQ